MLLKGGPTLDGAFISDDLINAISIIINACTGKGGETLFKSHALSQINIGILTFKQTNKVNILSNLLFLYLNSY